ncbi:MAG: tetratricopeptide repeat protein [bacterium]
MNKKFKILQSELKKGNVSVFLILFFVVILALGLYYFTSKPKVASEKTLEQQFSERLPALQKEIETNPGSSALRQELGVVKYAIGDIEGAKDAYEKGVELDSGNAVMHNNLGNTYRDLKDYVKAEAEYRTAMKINPKLTTSYMNLASVYNYILSKPEVALSIYDEGIKANPTYVDFYNSKALVYEQQGQKAKANEMFTKALSVQPGNPAATAGLARTKK